MFGYIRPCHSELKVKDFEAYKAVYCGLCRTLGKRYGFVARMTLNYDFTLLAMLLACHETEPCIQLGRCPVHPLQKRPMCATTPSLEVAADESVILTYWKLRDSVADHSFWKGIPPRFAAFFLRGAYQKAALRRPSFDRTVVECLTRLADLERTNSPSLDRTADAFASILKAAAPHTEDQTANRALEQLLYHVGRWIYLVDAVDDLEDDRKNQSYNPLLARFKDQPDMEYLRTTLSQSRALICSAYQLVDFGRWSDVLDNIFYLGLPMVEKLVFSGTWREAQKTIGRMTK